MKQVLIIEDDQDIANLIEIHLNDLNFEVVKVYNGREGLLEALDNKYSIIILDIMLPEMDGFEVCKRIRMEKIATPILMLTSKTDEVDKVLGLEIGADDYLTKPFNIRELMARVKAILRRVESVQSNQGKEIKYENFYLNVEMRIVTVEGREIELSPKEFDLLVLMSSNPRRTYSRMQLLEQIWGIEFQGYEHTVNSHINRLRSKIETDMNNPKYILTTWGVGYYFNNQ